MYVESKIITETENTIDKLSHKYKEKSEFTANRNHSQQTMVVPYTRGISGLNTY